MISSFVSFHFIFPSIISRNQLKKRDQEKEDIFLFGIKKIYNRIGKELS